MLVLKRTWLSVLPAGAFTSKLKNWLAVLFLLSQVACLDALVGEECIDGYTLCGDRCLPTTGCDLGDGGIDGQAVNRETLWPFDGVEDSQGENIQDVLTNDETMGDVSTDGADELLEKIDAAEMEEVNPTVVIDAPISVDMTGFQVADGGTDSPVIQVLTPEVGQGEDGSPDQALVSPPLLDTAIGASETFDSAAEGPVDTITTPDQSPDSIADGAGIIDLGSEQRVDVQLDSHQDLVDGSCVNCLDAQVDQVIHVDLQNLPETAADTPLVCSGTSILCNGQCVDTNTNPNHCGTCDVTCPSGACSAGTCVVCASGETGCGTQCQNLSTSPLNCGTCGNVCPSGFCNHGHCEATSTGRVIVIGHDYMQRSSTITRLLGNAVFLRSMTSLRLSMYEGTGNATAIQSTKAAITQMATSMSRVFTLTTVTAADVPSALESTDVFLISAQETASNAELTQLGTTWTTPLTSFVNLGGTVILLDAIYHANNGTHQILQSANLLTVTSRTLATRDICTVSGTSDVLSIGLNPTYTCNENSVGYLTSEATAVIQASGQAVVIHKIF